MLEIGKALVSLDLVEEHFLCDLFKCKGACCVEGDSGAPLTPEEAIKLEEILPLVEPYMTPEGKAVVGHQGTSVVDSDGDTVTPLVNNRECAFTFKDERGIVKCGVEKAFLDGKTDFRKPISCQLFPIRITEYKRFDAVNYQELKICQPGRECGAGQKLPLYQFLKEPLIRKYGESWYEQLAFAAEAEPWKK
ncbi:DUF3109 family protein [uncultured Sunxiuqinia sp.]|jgi:uncharacterized protein DUF3109|uniref:DUF3109 family protein n=1 Tax=uncultured Sunxiuqinia sp. TaxID=1573825 RepID=UPI0030D73E8C|tara:strand:+ start:11601 stop:12176 length:576 start_codon:yes stop_codon:yes gene_type:complete